MQQIQVDTTLSATGRRRQRMCSMLTESLMQQVVGARQRQTSIGRQKYVFSEGMEVILLSPGVAQLNQVYSTAKKRISREWIKAMLSGCVSSNPPSDGKIGRRLTILGQTRSSLQTVSSQSSERRGSEVVSLRTQSVPSETEEVMAEAIISYDASADIDVSSVRLTMDQSLFG